MTEEYEVLCNECGVANYYESDFEEEECPVHCVNCGNEFIAVNGVIVKS